MNTEQEKEYLGIIDDINAEMTENGSKWQFVHGKFYHEDILDPPIVTFNCYLYDKESDKMSPWPLAYVVNDYVTPELFRQLYQEIADYPEGFIKKMEEFSQKKFDESGRI